jgi:hypothetical protein
LKSTLESRIAAHCFRTPRSGLISMSGKSGDAL